MKTLSFGALLLAMFALPACASETDDLEAAASSDDELKGGGGEQTFDYGCAQTFLTFGPRPATAAGGATHTWNYSVCSAVSSTRAVVLVDPKAKTPTVTLEGPNGQTVQGSVTTATYNGDPMKAVVAQYDGAIATGSSWRVIVRNEARARLNYYIIMQ